jgi:effector-binding domain-containing protein
MQTNYRVRDRDGMTILARALDVRLSDIGGAIGSSFADVYGYLGAHGVRPVDPPFVIYHGTPDAGDEPFPIEICAPVPAGIDPPAGWTRRELPAGTFASVLNIGPYDTLGTAYAELERWIDGRRMEIAGPPREVYLSDPTTAPADIRTVIELPVVEAEVAAATLA